jgi:putative PEP-CTERM system histidine kinase
MFEMIVSAISAALLLILSVYTIAKQRSRTNVMLSFSVLLLASLEIIDRASVYLSYDPIALKKIALHLESLLPATLLLFSLTFARQISHRSISALWWALLGMSALFPLSTVLVSADSFFYTPDLQIEQMMFLGDAGYWFYMGVMVYCILAIMNIEATYSSASVSEKWRIKFEVIGVGSILAVLIFYFSQGLLYRSINMDLIPARSGVFIIASVLIGYSKIFRGNSVRIAVSQYILYRSLTLLSVGLYLLILGLIGEGLRYFGVSFSRDLTIFTAFATGISMLIVLLSGRMKRRAVVFLRKHFYAYKHDYRDEWLKFTEYLSSCKTIEDVHNAILTTYRETFGLKGASLYLLDKETKTYTLAATHNMSGGERRLEISPGLVSYFVERGRVFNPFDGEYNPTSEESSFVHETDAKLIVPLINNEVVAGVVVLGEHLAPEKLTYEDYDLMKTLARQASLAILNFRLSEELVETREVAVVAKISSFVIHDLKNLATNLSLVLDNAKNYIGDPEFQNDMIDTVKSTLNKMKGLIQKLKRLPEKSTLHSELTDVHLLTKTVVDEIKGAREKANIIYSGSPVTSVVDREEIKKVILNIILNALDATGENGLIEIETGIDKENIYIRVKDNGCGMEKEFIVNQLFKPFRTTKKKGLGIGLYQCKQIVTAHGGRIDVESLPGKGSAFTVYLPFAKEESFATY